MVYITLQVIFVSRDNKDSRKIVGDTINTRAEMKKRRKSLRRSFNKKASQNTNQIQNSEAVESPGPVEPTEDGGDEIMSWPQTILFPEGYILI